jgi:hypothetical protein
MVAGAPAVSVPPGGKTVNQFPPELVLMPEVNVSGELFKLCRRTV